MGVFLCFKIYFIFWIRESRLVVPLEFVRGVALW